MLVNWNLNKTESSTSGKKGKIKSNLLGLNSQKIFEDSINEAIMDSSTADILDSSQVLEGLDLIERKLLDQPNQANFFEYKAYIKMVSDKVMKKAFKLKVLKDPRKKQYEIVRVLDENLSELFRMVMRNSENRNKITNLLGTIKGIILDLNV